MQQVAGNTPTRHQKSPILSTRRLFQSTLDPRARVNFTRPQPVGLTSTLSSTRAPTCYPCPLPGLVDYATLALLTIDRKFDQVHSDLFSHHDSIFAVCFSIRNLDIPGDEISRSIHVIFYGDNFAQWSQAMRNYLKGRKL